MVKYIVTGSKVVFGTGLVLGLSNEQAKIRSLQLKKSGKNYQVLSNVEFKKGEVIDIVTKNLTKATLGQLELAEPQEKNIPLFFIKCKDFQITRQLQAYLKAHNIISTYHYTPLHITVPGKKYGTMVGEDKFTSLESKKLLRLPLFFEIKKRDIRRVVNEIYNYFGEKLDVT